MNAYVGPSRWVSRFGTVGGCGRVIALLVAFVAGALPIRADDTPTPTPAPTATPFTCEGTARYWVGGGGSAADPAHWACTSGGSGGAAPPACVTAGDAYQSVNDCVWDASSGLTTNAQIGTTGLCCRDADWSAVASEEGNAAGFFGDGFFVAGSLSMGAGVALSASAGPLVLTATEGEHTLAIADLPWALPPMSGIDLHGSGTYGDHAVWNVVANTGYAGSVTLGYGTLQLNGHRMNAGNVQSGHGTAPADAFTLDFGELIPNTEVPVIWVFGTWSIPSTTIAPHESTLTFGTVGMFPAFPTATFDGADQAYTRIHADVYDGGQWEVNGSATIDVLGVDTQVCAAVPVICHGEEERGTTATMTVQAGTTQTVADWQVSGSSDLPLILESSTPGTAWTLQCTAVAGCASDYLVLSDSTCSGNTPCYAGEHSVDGGGNSNWIFADPPPTPTPTLTPTPGPVSCEAESDFCAAVFGNGESCVACLCGDSGIVSQCNDESPSSTVCATEVDCLVHGGCPCAMSDTCAAAIASSCGGANQCNCAAGSTATPTATPTPCTSGTRYWVGGAGSAEEHASWDDPANWAATSGGTGGAGAPGCVAVGDTYQGCNDVVFDQNSGIAADQTAYVSFDHACAQSFDTSAVTGLALIFELDQNTAANELIVSGTFRPAGLTQLNTALIRLTASEGTHDFASSAWWLGRKVDFHGTGRATDHAVWRMRHFHAFPYRGDVDPKIVFGNGTLDATDCGPVDPDDTNLISVIQGVDIIGDPASAGFTFLPAGNEDGSGPPACDFRAERLWSPGGALTIVPPTPPLTWRLSFIEIGAAISAGCTIGECPVEMGSTVTFDAANLTYGRVMVNFDNCCHGGGGNWRECPQGEGTTTFRVTGGGVIDTFGSDDLSHLGTTNLAYQYCEPVMEIESGTTYEVRHWKLIGTEEFPLTIRASTPEVPWTLHCTDPAGCATDHLILSDSICTGMPCYAGAHSSVDSFSQAHGWSASDPPPTPTPTPMTCDADADLCTVLVRDNRNCVDCLCGNGIVTDCETTPTSSVCSDEVACVLADSCKEATPCPLSPTCAAALEETCGGPSQCNCAPTPTPTP